MRVLPKLFSRLALVFFLSFSLVPAVQSEMTSAEVQTIRADEQAVRAAVEQWILVLNAMLNGDPEPLKGLFVQSDEAMYMGAEGSYRIGWPAIYADWTAQAKASSGGTVKAIDVHVVVSGDLAMASHITTGPVRQPNGEMNENFVRETSVFRREDGQWLMIGHHADAIPYWEAAFGKQPD